MSIPDVEQLWQVKKTWALWKTNTTSMEAAQLNRNKQISKGYSEKVQGEAEQGLVVEMYLNHDLVATPTMQKELLHYYRTGNVLKNGVEGSSVFGNMKRSSSPTRQCNWTLFDPETKQFLHYLSHPFQMLISASKARLEDPYTGWILKPNQRRKTSMQITRLFSQH